MEINPSRNFVARSHLRALWGTSAVLSSWVGGLPSEPLQMYRSWDSGEEMLPQLAIATHDYFVHLLMQLNQDSILFCGIWTLSWFLQFRRTQCHDVTIRSNVSSPDPGWNISALAMFLPGDLRLFVSRANYRERERRMRDTIEAYRGGGGVVTFFSYIRRGRAFMLQLPKQRKQLRKITRESNEKREPSYSARDTQPAFEIINCNGNAHREIWTSWHDRW